MTGPDRLELRGKQNPAENPDPDFQRGFEAGRIASEPSAFAVFRLLVARQRNALDPIERMKRGYPKPSEFTLEGDRQAEVYVGGYISGLRSFLSEHGFSINPPIGLISTVILRGFDALDGYVDGLGRKHPKLYDKLTQRKKPSQAEYEEEERRSGYALGFAVGLMRDLGIRVNLADIPEDAETFEDFDLGRNGEARRSQQQYYRDLTGYKYLDFYEQQRELRSQRAYELGLTVWLKQQGIEGVEVWDIGDPDALEGFKASLAGKTIPEFEVPQESWWRLSPLGAALKDIIADSRGEKINMRNRVYDERQLRKTPTIPQIRQAHRERGYGLGKKAREQRLAREQAASDQQIPPQQ